MVYESVAAIIGQIMGMTPEEVVPEAHLYNELDMDSLDLSQVLLALENQWGIDISNEASAGLRTVQDLVGAIEGAKGGSAL